MIRNFSSKAAQDIYDGTNSRHSRRLPSELHKKATRLHDQVNSATKIDTLLIPPSNRLEKLTGNLKGYWSVRINKQWRVIFEWEGPDAYNVDIVDYH
jgi:proteic killer suppression protein